MSPPPPPSASPLATCDVATLRTGEPRSGRRSSSRPPRRVPLALEPTGDVLDDGLVDAAFDEPADEGAAWLELRPGDFAAGVRLDWPLEPVSWKHVFRAETDAGDPVAVHAQRRDAGAAARDEFWHGARALRRISRLRRVEGVLAIRAVAPDGRAVVTDLTTGASLDDLAQLGWSFRETLSAFERVCSAVAALHDEGVVHGLLQPSTVLLDERQRPLVADAGLVEVTYAIRCDPARAATYRAYAAPEVLAGEAATPRSDVHALGRLLDRMLARREPVPEGAPLARLEHLASMPAGLVRIVRKATALDPDRRYASVARLLEDVRAYDDADAVGTPHPEWVEPNLGAQPEAEPESRPSAAIVSIRGSVPAPASYGPSVIAVLPMIPRSPPVPRFEPAHSPAERAPRPAPPPLPAAPAASPGAGRRTAQDGRWMPLVGGATAAAGAVHVLVATHDWRGVALAAAGLGLTVLARRRAGRPKAEPRAT